MDNPIVRKVGWITFTVIFAMLAVYRWNDLKVTNGLMASWGIFANLGWFYLIIAVLSLLMLKYDRKVRAMMILSAMKTDATKDNIKNAQRLLEDIDDWEKVRSNPKSTPKEIKTAETKIAKLREQIAKLKS